MNPLDTIAERRLQEAVDAGLLDDYAGKGEPLELEDLSALDPEIRGAYVVLKGHGFVSEEQEIRHELVRLDDLLRACREDGARERLADERERKRLRFALL